MPRIVKDQIDDGRSTRWDDHRETRRAELVEAAVAAIDEHGPTASIARDRRVRRRQQAGALPLLLRQGRPLPRRRRAGAPSQVLDGLVPGPAQRTAAARAGREGCAAYLALISRAPARVLPAGRAPERRGPARRRQGDGRGRDRAHPGRRASASSASTPPAPSPGPTAWSGSGLSTGEWWLRRRTMSRTAVVAAPQPFVWNAFEGIAREHGVASTARAGCGWSPAENGDRPREATPERVRRTRPTSHGPPDVEVEVTPARSLRADRRPLPLVGPDRRRARRAPTTLRDDQQLVYARRTGRRRRHDCPTSTRGAASASAAPGRPPF